MKDQKSWIEKAKDIPNWIIGVTAFLVSIAGFIVAFRGDHYLYATLLGMTIFIGLLYIFTYIAYARSPSPFGGRGAFRFERYRRLALSANVGLIIIAVIILNSGVGRRYLRYAIRGTPTPPKESGMPLDAAALEPGIYISRIIEDSDSGFPDSTKLAAWLAANGDYIVDSIRVIHYPSTKLSLGRSGALYPDANYVFRYREGSDEIYALKPALQLSSTDQREVYFTLGLVPEGRFGGDGGYVQAIIYYHTSSGKKGSLVVEDPPNDIVFLSQLIQMNVWTQIGNGENIMVSPNGIQRGYEEELRGLDNVVEYSPLRFTDFVYPYIEDPIYLNEYYLLDSFFTLNSLPTDAPYISLGTRKKLNEILIKQEKVSEIIANLPTGIRINFDICAGLATVQCKQALLKMSSQAEYFPESAKALVFSHLLQPDATLADFALANLNTLEENTFISNELIFALTIHPIGLWFDALLKIAQFNDDACRALYLRESKIDQAQSERVKYVCNQ